MQVHVLPKEFNGDPQAVAMLQAFYSRSLEPIESRLARMGNDVTKVKAALKRVYLGYGHNSVADCGTTTFFVEGVSIVAAKAIQEDGLYNGQECSTRYIKLSGDLCEQSGNVTAFANEWFGMFHDILQPLTDGIRAAHPYELDEGAGHPKGSIIIGDYKEWENTTAAYAFDIARAWIPTSALTNLSWHTTLRKLNERTSQLLAHPLTEVREIAIAIRNKAVELYPDAVAPFALKDTEQVNWLDKYLSLWYAQPVDVKTPFAFKARGKIYDISILNERPRHAPIPASASPDFGITMSGTIDYGCWRDLQRHRRQIGAPPLLLATSGFHPWYLEQLKLYVDPALYNNIENNTVRNLRDQQFLISENGLDSSGYQAHYQYGLPLGTNVTYSYSFGLAQAVYLAELRSGNTVHPILRKHAQALGEFLTRSGLRVDYDVYPSRFDLKRGRQTIVENANGTD